MRIDLSQQFRDLAEDQGGAVARRQLLRAGLTDEAVAAHLKAGRWQRPYAGVYVTYTGPLARESQLWAAVLYAGAGATLSHQTAAESWALLDNPDPLIHLTVPAPRRVAAQPGLCIHRSRRLEQARHPVRRPPRTQVEDTVLDLIDAAANFGEVVGWVTRACQRRRTTPERLLVAFGRRENTRWRRAVEAVLADVSDGAETPLERTYLTKVERPHRLPKGRRQRHHRVGGASQYVDVEYEEYGLIVELDGRIGHVDDGVFRDRRRDNYWTAEGLRTLRYGWVDTHVDSCQTALQVASILRRSGWTGRLRRCGPACPDVSG